MVVLTTALLGAGSGVIGSLLLLRKRSLMGDVLSHATLPGIVAAFALLSTAGLAAKQWFPLLVGATLSGLAGVGVMVAIRRTTRLRDDVAMGIVLSVFFGIGVAMLQMVRDLPDAAGLSSFIYGKTASIISFDLVGISIVAVLVLSVVLLLGKELVLLCFDDGFAAAQGWPVAMLDFLLLGLVTLMTVAGLQSVGLVLIIAFLIIPAAAARFWTGRVGTMMAVAAIIGALSGWAGASASAALPDAPAGAVIVLAAAAIFAISLIGGPRGVWCRQRELSRLKDRVGRQHLLRSIFEILEDAGPPTANRPVSLDDLLEQRSWSPRELRRLLRRARRHGSTEPCGNGGFVLLSEAGFGEASRITRNHRLWEIYLIRHADIAPSHVDRDADMVEHILGPEMVRQLERELDPVLPLPPNPHAR
jgi:manganese/zinc/iron transport system permease protein